MSAAMRQRRPRPLIDCAECGQRKRHASHGKCSACINRASRALRGATVKTHGYGGYTSGCRCQACRDAKAAYMADRRGNAFLNTGPEPVEGIAHGRSGYEERGCRCGICLEAKRGDWRREQRRRRARAGAAA
jgi:hypothetical protein